VTFAKTTRVRWFLVFWLFLLSAVSYLDRVNISVAGGAIADAYRLSDVQLGNVFSAMLVGYALFQTVGGRLADRFGPRRVLTAGVIWWGIFTALTALVPAHIVGALYLFLAVRFLLGAGEAVIYPSANQFIAQWIPVRERGMANGWIFAGVGAGAVLTLPLIPYLMIHYGWRFSFWVCAVIGFLAGGVWFLAARDTPAAHPRVSASELAAIQSGLTLANAHDKPSGQNTALLPWTRVLQSKEVRAVTLSYFCYGYVAWIFFSWFYLYLAKVRALDLKTSAFYSMLPFLAMLVCCLLGGTINDRFTRWRGPRLGRCGLAACAITLAGVFIALGSQVQSARLASVVLAGGAGALYLSQSSFWSVTADIAGASSGSVSGLMNTGNQIGAAITASLTPWIAARFGWTASFLAAAVLCVVGAVSWLVVDPTKTLFPVQATPGEGLVDVAAPADHPASRLRVHKSSSSQIMAKLNIKAKRECMWDLVSLGEVMLRLDPGDERISTTRHFRAWEGGGEYNVARGLKRCFGMDTAIVTALADNPLGRLVEDLMLQGGVSQKYVRWVPFDGVGRSVRNGLNFTERGFGIRPALGCSDRGHTAVSQLRPGEIDWDQIFAKDGARWFHTGGIFCALSETAPSVAQEAMEAAKRAGTVVSYDLNYRASLWKSTGGKAKAQETNRRLAPLMDVMLGNEEDFTAALGFPVSGLDEHHSRLEATGFKQMIDRVVREYPSLAVIATTLRHAKTATRNDWGALCYCDGKFYEAPVRENLEIYDRVGGGDSFASGLIYGFLSGKDPQWSVECGAAHGALAMTTPGDTTMATLAEVLQAMTSKTARIER
jgi:2-dehydro-3-deoxygluconokinase